MTNDTPMPGMVARYEAKGSAYADMETEARDAFQALFQDRDWAFLACQVEPAEQEPSFGGSARVSVWQGTFFAITSTEEISHGR